MESLKNILNPSNIVSPKGLPVTCRHPRPHALNDVLRKARKASKNIKQNIRKQQTKQTCGPPPSPNSTPKPPTGPTGGPVAPPPPQRPAHGPRAVVRIPTVRGVRRLASGGETVPEGGELTSFLSSTSTPTSRWILFEDASSASGQN